LGDNLDDTAAQNTPMAQQQISAASWFHFCRGHVTAALLAVGFLVSVKGVKRRLFHRSSVAHVADRDFFLDAVHTVYGLRYAHAFYGDSDEPGVNRHAGGLIFPGDRLPDYFDFVYFSFVIGMTVRYRTCRSPRAACAASLCSTAFLVRVQHNDSGAADQTVSVCYSRAAFRQKLTAIKAGVFLRRLTD